MSANLTSEHTVSFELNGEVVSVKVPAHTRLTDVLRDECAQSDVKVGCNAGDCGACSVLIDGDCVCACLTSVEQVAGCKVDTLSGLVQSDPIARQVADAFLQYGAAQCGICTPGMLVSATALLRENPEPDEQQVADALGGVLCRCTGYRKIIDAVVNANKLSGDATSKAGSNGDVTAAATSMATASSIGNASSTSDIVTLLATSDSHRPTTSQAEIVDMRNVDGGVGESIARLDGAEKVEGRDLFGDDVAPADALRCIVVRSPFHHATFELGDIAAFINNLDGIECVLTAKDVPGENRHGVIPPFIDQPVFAEHVTLFKGEAIAAVVGVASAINASVLELFPVTWKEQTPHLVPADAQTSDAALVHADRAGNVMCRGKVKRGDATKGLAAGHIKVEGRYQTEFIEHAYIEPEAGYAVRVGDRIEVHGCTQTPFMNRDSLAKVMGLEPTAVRINASAIGGGFGSKLDLSYQPYIAIAAWKLNKPVRITYTRRESMQSTTKRHPADMHVQIAADKDGKLTALQFDGVFNTGAYASWGPTVANRVPVHASGPYCVPNYLANTVAVHTHTVPAGAFRGFGVPQAAIAQECLFDKLADKLNIDRLTFRVMNALSNGQPTATGQVFESSVGIKDCLLSLQEHWTSLSASVDVFNNQAVIDGTAVRRGIGVASGWYGCGNTSLPNPSCIKAGIKADGTVCLHQGAVDIGQGSNTVISQMFASALGVDVGSIKRLSSDTDITPDAGKTSASRQTFISGNAARKSGLALRKEILRLSNASDASSIRFGSGAAVIHDGNAPETTVDLSAMCVDEDGYVLSVAESYDAPIKALDDNGQGNPYAQYGYAAHLVELAVDIELGSVDLIKFYAAHDVGRAINPNLVEGQIHGGVAQGIGLALMESFIPARTENLHDYLIPTIGDVPPIETIIVEVHDEHGPYGAKGLGEHVLIPTAPSILNAIRHACGAEIHHLPASPDKVLAAIHAVSDGELGKHS